jgi:hypothetical protein
MQISLAFWQWFFQILAVFFIVGGLAGIAVGTGLIVNGSRTLAFLNNVDHWISMRRAIKPLEVPRDTTGIVQKYMRLLAAIFVVGGAYSLYVLIAQFNADAIIFSFKLGETPALIGLLLLDAIRWFLLAGNLAAVVIGIMMAFFPDKLNALEARGSRWFSDRGFTDVVDRMHTRLDEWVAAAPIAAGWILAIGSFVVVVSYVIMLLIQV